MLESTFEVPNDRDSKTRLLARIKAEAASEGIALTGNEDAGSFEGKTLIGRVAGSYQVDNTTLTVRLEKHPTLIPKPILRALLDRLFH